MAWAMALRLATHDGPFHADDVLACALVRVFRDPEVEVVRTRDPERLAEADVVVDVGGEHDPAAGRFDHHQKSYEGPRSSAGMVLDWLEAEGDLAPALAQRLREEVVDYVDAVDNGRRRPEEGVPCLSTVLGTLNELAEGDFDRWYLRAVDVASDYLRAFRAGVRRAEEAAETVRAAMRAAVAEERNVLFFDRYVKWKPTYFAEGGQAHPTQYALFPGPKGKDWRVVTIPVELGSREDKRKLPESWGGLEGAALEEVTGVPGSVFCHRNRFIASFTSREAALKALERWDRLAAPTPDA